MVTQAGHFKAGLLVAETRSMKAPWGSWRLVRKHNCYTGEQRMTCEKFIKCCGAALLFIGLARVTPHTVTKLQGAIPYHNSLKPEATCAAPRICVGSVRDLGQRIESRYPCKVLVTTYNVG